MISLIIKSQGMKETAKIKISSIKRSYGLMVLWSYGHIKNLNKLYKNFTYKERVRRLVTDPPFC